jgi:multidrug efflux system membrane fusion protein
LGHRVRLRTIPLLLLLLTVPISSVEHFSIGSSGMRETGRSQTDASVPPATEASAASEHPAVPIVAATVEQRDVPEYLYGVGAVQAFKTVAVSSRVDGQLMNLQFKEGQQVRAGDVLAQLDPRPFQATLRQMEANIRRDEAQLQGAEAELGRLSSLAAREFASRSSIDNQRAQVGQFKAAIEADTAQLDRAKIELDYATIRSPIDGRAGLRLVDEGNLIRAGDRAPIVVVNQIQPIAVIFAVPEDELPKVNWRLANGTAPAVTAFGRDGQTVLADGTLSTIDNVIDRRSGTFKLKASFANEKNTLWPGQFVNLRLHIGTRHEGIVVPEAALQHGPDGAYVYVVELNSTVSMRAIKTAAAQNGAVLIDTGLRAGERVVVDGQFRLQPGSAITEIRSEEVSRPGRPASNGLDPTRS